MSNDLQLGIEALKRGEFSAAVRHLEAAAREAPESAVPLLCLGAAYSECHRTRDAVRALTLAVRIDPANARAHYNLGIALERAGQVEEAVDALRIAVALDPGHARAVEALERAESAATPDPDTVIVPVRGARPRPADEHGGRPEPDARETRQIPAVPSPPPSPPPVPTPPPAPAASAPPAEEPWRACPECTARNAATARVCWECGAFLRPAIIETCPYCTAALHKVKRGNVEVKACEGCGGIWLERADLVALLAEPRKRQAVVLAAVKARRKGTILRINPALICARCQLIMLGGPMHEVTMYPVHACPRCSACFIGQKALEEIALGRPV